jgi:hypothetical protein
MAPIGFFCYNLNVSVLFILFHRNFKSIVTKIDELAAMMSKSALEKAQKKAKFFNNFTFAYVIFFGLNYIAMVIMIVLDETGEMYNILGIHYFFFDATKSPMREIQFFVGMPAGIFIEALILGFQLCYVNLCIHVDALYSDLFDEIETIAADGLREKIVKILDSFANIKKQIAEIREFFKFIIFMRVFSDIMILGSSLTYYKNMAELISFFLYCPMVFYDIWIYCYGSRLMVGKVS